MKRDDVMFSVRLALRDPLIRWGSIANYAVFCIASGLFFWRVFPTIRRTGLITLHYSTYLGIDDVRAWPWMFLIPGIALTILLFDTMLALTLFQKDRLASRSLVAFQGVALFFWVLGVFFITRINL